MRGGLLAHRCAALLCALALLVAACGEGGDDLSGAAEDLREAAEEAVEGARDALSEADGQPGEPAPDGGAPGAGGPGDQGPGGVGGGAGAGEPGAPAQDAAPPPATSLPGDRDPLGAMCREYLRPRVPRLVVEIDHQAGAAPSQAAVDHLLSTLRGVVDKPGGVHYAGGSEIPGGPQTWTAADVRATAARHRDHHSSPDQVVVYALGLRGELDNRGALGVAVNATEFAVFPDRIGDVMTALLGGRSAIERAVIVHEVGHLLCLVNIGYRSEIGHEDPQHPGHSSDRDSVMYWAIENSAVGQVFSGPPPADFTANDRADLEGLRTGRY